MRLFPDTVGVEVPILIRQIFSGQDLMSESLIGPAEGQKLSSFHGLVCIAIFEGVGAISKITSPGGVL